MTAITSNKNWTIRSPKKILECQSNSGSVKLISEKFCNYKFPSVEWELCLQLTPYSVNVWIRQIWLKSLNSLVNTKYKIYAKKDFIQVDIARSATYKFENQRQLGYTTIYLDKVICSDGNLILCCEVEIDSHNLNDDLQHTYIDMLDEEILTDFVIKVDDQVIKTHRCILAKNSKVFHKMFEQEFMTEAKNGEVIISDTTPECIRAMLEFFYTGMVSDDKMKSHSDEIFAIAHKYQVEMLKCLCERFMSYNINNENMVKYCGIINLYDTPILEKACTDYIRVNGKNFLKSKEWEEIKNNYQSVVPRFLESIVENLDK
uniref:BTB domain-containing protein n=1 Tax=Meloidogyne enterolobii TaxID=390850 RepID=A0A6V7WVA5_MELEN|nr:unnamed protein product [Meloidogyne enterolobii]